MNTENEKLWFVYIGDHHEGPLSVREVFEKKKQGQVNPESFVWKEGMADWLMLSQASELKQALDSFSAEEPQDSREDLATEEATSPDAAVPEASVDSPEEPSPSADAPEAPAPEEGFSASISPIENGDSGTLSKEIKRPKKSPKKSFAKPILAGALVVLLALVAGLSFASRSSNPGLHARVRPTIDRMVEKAPFLGVLFKRVPNLQDVKPEDQQELESARSGTPEVAARIGIALSTSDPNRPSFHISSNLPDQTRIEVLIVGEPETLLNRLQFSGQNTVRLSHGFGSSEVFLVEGGQPLPKGDYRVYAYESQDQFDAVKGVLSAAPASRGNAKLPPEIPADAKFVFSRKYFLGGEKDDTYRTRLKAFHENIKQKADKELGELHEYSKMLIDQYNALSGEFQKILKAKKPTGSQKNAWKKASSSWLKFSGQLDQAVQTWSPETLQNEFFYGKAYGYIRGAFQSMRALFQMEIDYVEKPQDRAGFEIQHGKAQSEARDALELMKSKMDALFNAPKAPGGLPSREGL